MQRRMARVAKAVVAGVVALVLLPVAATASGAQAASPRAIQPLELTMTEGELLIRDAEEPYALEQPTTITGSHDTGPGGSGAVTGGTLSTPTISFETVALGLPVFVDATFTQVAPGTGTGVIDADGNVTFSTSLTVDLDIEVGDPVVLTAQCRATPVHIQLDSVAPYDPETGLVTVRDADFSVPEVTGENCKSPVDSNVNELLAGGGHSLTLTLEEEDLALPEPATCPTLTALELSPVGEATLGDPVTYTATVTPDPAGEGLPECEEAEGVTPSGVVELRADDTLLGTATLDGTGSATFTDDSLPAGTFDLTAVYRGAAPYGGSTSAPQPYRIAAPPAIVADLPEFVEIGADPVEFDVSLTNTGFGSDVINARLDIGLQRQDAVTTEVDRAATLIEYFDGTDWVPVPFQGSGWGMTSVPDANGVPLATGDQVVHRLRISVGAGETDPPAGRFRVAFGIIAVDPQTGEPATVNPQQWEPASAITLSTTFVNEERAESTILVEDGLIPHTVRQGQTLYLPRIQVDSPLRPVTGGTIRLLIDGAPARFRTSVTPPEFGYVEETPAYVEGFGDPDATIPIAPDMATGAHTLTVVYSGGSLHQPAQLHFPFTLLPARGATYECVANFIVRYVFQANVVAHANLPAARPSGSTVPLSQLDVTLYTDRGIAVRNFGQNLPPVAEVADPPTFFQPLSSIDFGFGAAGSGQATAMTLTNNSPLPASPNPAPPSAVDQVVGFQGEGGSVAVEGSPGDVVDVPLESVDVAGNLFGIGVGLTCTPLDAPLSLGQVTVAGTTLAVDAPDPTREGDDVTLTATVAPEGSSGTVVFRDGSTDIGYTTLRSDGTASITTDDLAAGAHSLTASFFGGLGAVSTTSEPVALEVLPQYDCSAFAEEGNGAVVRLVYMELLRRCPDQAGFDYWTGRLDDGMSRARFAATISGLSEAQGVLVDKAYRLLLERDADAAGRAHWVGRLQAGQRYDTLLVQLASSGEFWEKAGATEEGFVTRLYQRALLREPDTAGLQHWVGRLEAGVPRHVVARQFVGSSETMGRLATAAYQEILDRTPTTAERQAAIDHLRTTGDLDALYAQLIDLDEFVDRAQELPNF